MMRCRGQCPLQPRRKRDERVRGREGCCVSWDVYIQDLPDGVRSVSEIPDDFVPRALGPRDEIINRLKRAAPDITFVDATQGRIDFTGGSIEVSVDEDDPCQCVALFVRGGDEAVGRVIAIVEALGGKALDAGSEDGVFDTARARESMTAWRGYRDQAVGETGPAAPTQESVRGRGARRRSWWKFW
jgi:hypothetical protein